MSGDTLSLLTRLKALTELQLEHARADQWRPLAQLDLERRALLDDLGTAGCASAASSTLRALSTELIALDRQLLAEVRNRRNALARQSRKAHAQQSAFIDYSQAKRLVHRAPGD